MNKQEQRAEVLKQIDEELAAIKGSQGRIRDLVNQIQGEWVIRKHYLKDVTSHAGVHARVGDVKYYGSKNPGTKFYRKGCMFDGPYETHGPDGGGVKVSQSPRDMVFIAECVAGDDTRYESQGNYVIEVVDRLDGEVFATIETPWRYRAKS